MADLARVARPWLLSLRRPIQTPTAKATPYIGLGLGYSRGVSNHQRPKSRGRFNESESASDRRKRESNTQARAATAHYLFPHTVVPPPLWRFPRSPAKFAQLVWLLTRNRVAALAELVAVYIMSVRAGWPRFAAKKRASIPAAKALHAQMSEAAAVGDKETLRRICTYELFQTLGGAIDARPARTRTEWELVRYTDTLRYPRVADFRVSFTNDMRVLKQVVVSISSVQRLTRYYEDGRPVPGTGRERHMVEHLVLQAPVADGTFEAGPWQIWGTLPEMPFEKIRDDDLMFREYMARGR
ncbi:hypothetical protein F4803DRAFT_483336 [Xylaria telfairii]|nr:hypothetical protein F4803DRAFT_483336 [Xylaria telfairii]